MCVSRRRPPTCLLPDGSPKFVTIVLRAVHQIVAPGIVEITVLQKANQTQSLKINNSTLNWMKLIKRVFLHTFVVLWFGPSTFQNLAIHVSTVRCQYQESSCCASVPTSPRNLESFSVHQIVDPGIVEITLFQKANQTQPLHNFTLKMKPFFSISFQNVFFSTLSRFRGFRGFVVWSFQVSKSDRPRIDRTLSVRRIFFLDLNLMSLVPPKKKKRRCPLKLLKLYRSYVVCVSTNNCPWTCPLKLLKLEKILAFPASQNPRPQLYFENVSFL